MKSTHKKATEGSSLKSRQRGQWCMQRMIYACNFCHSGKKMRILSNCHPSSQRKMNLPAAGNRGKRGGYLDQDNPLTAFQGIINSGWQFGRSPALEMWLTPFGFCLLWTISPAGPVACGQSWCSTNLPGWTAGQSVWQSQSAE